MKKSSKQFRRAILPVSILAAMAFSGSANAFKIDTDNEDLDVRWDNTIRYNAGWRMQDPAYYQSGSAVVGASESKWKSGDMITNRFDDLSEFDFIYKKDTGFRVSAALWYDSVYDGNAPRTGGPLNNLGSLLFPGGKWNNDVSRWYGKGGEILDAFVFTKFDLGSVPVNVKLGKHTIYWGETLFSITNGIAVGQSAIDLRKAAATPGVEAKEVFLPEQQLSFSAQISPELTIMGQYFLDWHPDRIMEGGTYFSAADFLWDTHNSNTLGLIPLGWNGTQGTVKEKSGAWGIAAKWRPEWLDGTAGFYYREYYPTAGRQLAISVANFKASYVWDRDVPRTKLYGVSLSKQLFGISFGTDVSYKKDNVIGANAFSMYNGFGVPATGWAPIADTYGFTQNMIAYDGKRNIPFTDVNMYDSAVLLAEFEYGAIDKITKNAGNAFQTGTLNTNPGIGAGCNITSRGGARNGCGTNGFYGINISFEPKWFQVFPGTDVTMPIFFGKGLHGNSFSYGPIEGAGGFSVGVAADVDAKYNFKLAYNGYLLKHTGYVQPTVPAGSGAANAGLGDFSHKGNLSFTAKATW